MATAVIVATGVTTAAAAPVESVVSAASTRSVPAPGIPETTVVGVWRAVFWSKSYDEAHSVLIWLADANAGMNEYKQNYVNGSWTVWERPIYVDPEPGTA